jgi:hypothetical protein
LTQKFCVTGDSFSGLYAEAGVLVGTVTGNVASGKYYEAGHHHNCAHGEFQMTLNANDNSFSGYIVCEIGCMLRRVGSVLTTIV